MSGFASVVISACESSPCSSRTSSRARTRSLAGRRVGVPPPKNTDVSGLFGTPARVNTDPESSISRESSSIYVDCEVPRSSVAV